MNDDPALAAQIVFFLEELGIAPQEVLGSRPLQAGLSGASTTRLELGSGAAVLKVVPASSELGVRNRAQRELAFYRDLASEIPLRVPHIRASYQGTEGFALLIEALQPSPQPEAWTAKMFLEAIEQLAQFHGTFWDAPETLARHHWLAQDANQMADGQVTKAARAAWHKLYKNSRFAHVLTIHELAWLERLIDKASEIQVFTESLPVTLCHGDCTTLNVLIDSADNLVWADWQEVRIGRGPEDIAFLLERASVSGAHVPYRKLLEAYRDHLERSVPLADIERVVQAAELRSRLLYWPTYLTGASATQLAAMLRRLHALAKTLGLAA